MTTRNRLSVVGHNIHGGAPRLLSTLFGDGLPWVNSSALCAQTDPEPWHPEKGGSTKAVKAICADCPLREPCAEWAITTDERFGVWGGLSERERRAERHRRALAAEPVKVEVPPEIDARIAHGSRAGARQHYRLGVPLCEPCREVERVIRAARRAA